MLEPGSVVLDAQGAQNRAHFDRIADLQLHLM